MRPFARDEFRERIARTKQEMEAAGIEVLLVVDPANMYYLSGYDATSYYVPQALIVALDEEEPFWVGREMDAACARLTVFMDEARIVGYPERYIGDRELHGMSAIGDLVRERGWASRRLAVEMDAVCFTPRAVGALEESPPGTRIADAGYLVNRLRLVKALVPAVVEGMETALDAARVGETCEGVEAAWRRAVGARGYDKPSRIGYSIGIGYAGLDWNERSASLKPGDKTVLQPNMVFHLMLGMWMGNRGFVLSETFRVTEGGPPETFSRLPRQVYARI
jgi:Xaa-Pro aminopeptidase